MLPQGEVSKKVPLSRANRQRASEGVQGFRPAARLPIPLWDGTEKVDAGNEISLALSTCLIELHRESIVERPADH
jgi:hypothetical protein